MFSGIGSGVGAMEGRSPVTAGPQALSIGQLRREELEGFPSQDSPIENGGYNIARSSSRGGRRRKLKDEDGRGDEYVGPEHLLSGISKWLLTITAIAVLVVALQAETEEVKDLSTITVTVMDKTISKRALPCA